MTDLQEKYRLPMSVNIIWTGKYRAIKRHMAINIQNIIQGLTNGFIKNLTKISKLTCKIPKRLINHLLLIEING